MQYICYVTPKKGLFDSQRGHDTQVEKPCSKRSQMPTQTTIYIKAFNHVRCRKKTLHDLKKKLSSIYV